jgi:hypothetical protein
VSQRTWFSTSEAFLLSKLVAHVHVLLCQCLNKTRHGMYIVYMHGKSRHVDGVVVTIALMNSLDCTQNMHSRTFIIW